MEKGALIEALAIARDDFDFDGEPTTTTPP